MAKLLLILFILGLFPLKSDAFAAYLAQRPAGAVAADFAAADFTEETRVRLIGGESFVLATLTSDEDAVVAVAIAASRLVLAGVTEVDADGSPNACSDLRGTFVPGVGEAYHLIQIAGRPFLVYVTSQAVDADLLGSIAYRMTLA